MTITRTLFRSGDTEYSINVALPSPRYPGSPLQYRGGPPATLIISQGQLDAILRARPEDRLVVIEEAAGILKYRRRRERSDALAWGSCVLRSTGLQLELEAAAHRSGHALAIAGPSQHR